MRRPLTVFVGGGVGASLRAALLAWGAPWGTVLPVPVLVANALGAFVLGLVFVLADEAGLLRAEARLFLAVGVLGGFTTFSTFAWGADLLVAQGARWVVALVYLAASVGGGVLAVSAGLATGRGLADRLDARRRAGRYRRDRGRGPRGVGVRGGQGGTVAMARPGWMGVALALGAAREGAP